MEVARSGVGNGSVGPGYLKEACSLNRQVERTVRLVEVSLRHDDFAGCRLGSETDLQTCRKRLLSLRGAWSDEVLVDHVLKLHLTLVKARRGGVRQVVGYRIQVRLLSAHS